MGGGEKMIVVAWLIPLAQLGMVYYEMRRWRHDHDPERLALSAVWLFCAIYYIRQLIGVVK